jgi:alpha-1,3-rhamnosyl/mannosyltransferase
VLEAMACGVPVACSNSSSLPEVAGDAGVLFDPEDEDAMRQAMQQILMDPATRTRCIEQGLRHASRYDWRTTAEATLDVMQRAVRLATRQGEGRPGRPAGSYRAATELLG